MLNVIPSLSFVIATPCVSITWTARFDGVFGSAKVAAGATSKSGSSSMSSSPSLLCCFKLDSIFVNIK